MDPTWIFVGMALVAGLAKFLASDRGGAAKGWLFPGTSDSSPHDPDTDWMNSTGMRPTSTRSLMVSDTSDGSTSDATMDVVNPASGLPMVDGRDVAGNAYGSSLQDGFGSSPDADFDSGTGPGGSGSDLGGGMGDGGSMFDD